MARVQAQSHLTSVMPRCTVSGGGAVLARGLCLCVQHRFHFFYNIRRHHQSGMWPLCVCHVCLMASLPECPGGGYQLRQPVCHRGRTQRDAFEEVCTHSKCIHTRGGFTLSTYCSATQSQVTSLRRATNRINCTQP